MRCVVDQVNSLSCKTHPDLVLRRSVDILTGRNLPGMFCFYEINPIQVRVAEARTSVLHFLTNVCAIVGGVFTVSGLVDSFLYHGQRVLLRKHEIGKLG